MSKAQELAVIRAAGVSVWQFLTPILAFTFILAALIIALVEPLGTSTFKQFSVMKAELSGAKPKLSFSTGGVWFRENSNKGNYIIHAEKFDSNVADRLLNVEVTLFSDDTEFSGRIEAESAILSAGRFILKNAREVHQNAPTARQDEISLASSLSVENLSQSFVPAKAVNIWQLPGYINRAAQTGIDVTRHNVRLQSLLALPLLLMSMVMVAACFSLPTGRMVSTAQTIGLAVLCGFVLFLVNDLTLLLGELGSVPPVLSSWSPAVIAMLLAISYLLSTEDG
jgi:lipopolysaccharide export system permease protein